jgi:uncharacterized protein (DUF1800 family)
MKIRKSFSADHFPANGGYEEGKQVLEMLSMHPSTAKFICTKLATRFVSDTPSAELVSKMADSYLKAMAISKLFW